MVASFLNLDKVTIGKFSVLTGYTEDAIRAKVERGVWLEGLVWFRAPDGRVLISLRGYDAWVEGQAFAPQASDASSSRRRQCD